MYRMAQNFDGGKFDELGVRKNLMSKIFTNWSRLTCKQLEENFEILTNC